MKLLDKARKIRDRLRTGNKSRVSGPDEASFAPPSTEQTYEINEVNEKSAISAESPPTLPEIFTQPPSPDFTLVCDAAGLHALAQFISHSAGPVAVDTETLGLRPKEHRLRLIQLHAAGTTFVVDAFKVDPSSLWPIVAEKELIAHNWMFDGSFLAEAGAPIVAVHDLMHLSRLVTADPAVRGGNSLEDISLRELEQPLDKSHQKSDWSGELTLEQLAYAAADARVTAQALPKLQAKIFAAGLDRVALLERRATPAILWMAAHGVAFDRARWEGMAEEVQAERAALAGQMDEHAPLGESAWNYNSNPQMKQLFSLLGHEVPNVKDSTLAGIDHLLAVLLRQYRAANKRVTTYGMKWTKKHVHADGRVYPAWKQLGAVTGRMSCGAPNMQQLPRGGDYRRCVVAPPGRVLVKCDWGQLHLRIIAGYVPEPAMRKAFDDGVDVHKATAAAMTGKTDADKRDRQLAKIANFGLCYGMGRVRFLSHCNATHKLGLTTEQAEQLRQDWFRVYPDIRAWHRRQFDGPVIVTVPSGRRCLNVTKFSDKLSYPILMIEADILKTALAECWERRDEVPGAFPIIACHDELVFECDWGRWQEVEAWLVDVMLTAAATWIAPVPVEVGTTVGTTWGGGEIQGEKTYRRI
jgi:DNA polymerase-1